MGEILKKQLTEKDSVLTEKDSTLEKVAVDFNNEMENVVRNQKAMETEKINLLKEQKDLQSLLNEQKTEKNEMKSELAELGIKLGIYENDIVKLTEAIESLKFQLKG